MLVQHRERAAGIGGLDEFAPSSASAEASAARMIGWSSARPIVHAFAGTA
jgi:hypothetical protein